MTPSPYTPSMFTLQDDATSAPGVISYGDHQQWYSAEIYFN